MLFLPVSWSPFENKVARELILETTYNRIWERKTKTETEKQHQKNCKCRACEASKLFEGGYSFLDVGCGSGFLATLLAKRYKEYYGVDISPLALAKAAEKGVKVVNVDINEEQLPFEDGYFDAVACLDVIEHVLNPFFLLKEINRVLRPGGTLVISTPNMRYWYHIMSLVVFGRFPRTSSDIEAYDGGHIHYFTRKDLAYLLRAHGFKVLNSSFLRNNFLGDFRFPGIILKGKKQTAIGSFGE